jgi:hypothetical protein
MAIFYAIVMAGRARAIPAKAPQPRHNSIATNAPRGRSPSSVVLSILRLRPFAAGLRVNQRTCHSPQRVQKHPPFMPNIQAFLLD